jgi:hypothetical protein
VDKRITLDITDKRNEYISSIVTPVNMKNAVFLVVTPCSLEAARRFGGIYRLQLQGRAEAGGKPVKVITTNIPGKGFVSVSLNYSTHKVCRSHAKSPLHRLTFKSHLNSLPSLHNDL